MEEKKPIGATISIIVIVLVLAFGAYYFLKQVPALDESVTLTSAEIQADTIISALSTQGTSTDIADIQKDLDATDFSGLETGLDNIAL